MVFKCKMCGGDLQTAADSSIATCMYCNSTMTVPRLDSEKRKNLYDRAEHFRRNNDYDRAMEVYNQILTEDQRDAEAYWSLVLCKYGIEYVEDPKTRRRIPTCNRARQVSIYGDEDYKAAIAYSDATAKIIYENEAKVIDKILKGILEISAKEEPFDIFICYKESAADGRRTVDSVLAQEMYYHLNEQGFKVFFSRITLEDKLGAAYEPYIFAALKSAQIMICLGTKPEHFQAIWVKNEWNRYLAMIKDGEKKTLIPAYKDIEPYDLPAEFSHLQALDMGRLGFIQDLSRGIQKILGSRNSSDAQIVKEMVNVTGVNAAALLKRAFFCLECSDWEKAAELLEQVLNENHECAEAYIGQLMLKKGLTQEAQLGNYPDSLSDELLYQYAIRFADNQYQQILEGYERQIQARITQEQMAAEIEAEKVRVETEAEKKRLAQSAEQERQEVAQRRSEGIRTLAAIFGVTFLLIYILMNWL